MEGGEIMLVTWKQNLKHLSKDEYLLLREMCRLSKNVYNESLYNIRQHYFAEKSFLRYEANYPIEKLSENYKLLGANLAQQTMKCVDSAFRSFFALLKLVEKRQYSRDAVRIPHYLPKDGLYPLHLPESFMKEDGTMLIPMSPLMKKRTDIRIKLNFPPQIRDKKIHQIHIVPKQGGKWFEATYLFDIEDTEKIDLDQTKALAIDLGINNFATCATSDGHAFIIDGKKIKSQNQWYNRYRVRLSSIKDRQKIKGDTKLMSRITEKRNHQIQDFIYCSAKYIVNYCVKNRIGNVVIGYNDGFQDRVNLGKINNQKFVMIPYGKFKDRLKFLCERYHINYQEQEESYTSKASFLDNDEMPVWNPRNPVQGSFSGKRIKRGLYQTKHGTLINADVNGALNIMRKSKLTDLSVLQCRGEVITPTRIRLS